MGIESLFFILILLFSVIIHEVSHGFMAYYLGDNTAKYAGRLTLNPIPHIDMMGSIIVPTLLVVSGSPFLFGWAKPVPFNPYNLRDQRWGTLYVAIAGVVANFSLAIIFGLFIRFGYGVIDLNPLFYDLLAQVVLLNLVLGVFNLIPVPPLDGSKVLFSLLPYRLHYIQEFLERNWMIGIMIVMLMAPNIVGPAVLFLMRLIIGF